ncbi:MULTISPECIES: helix-turn-helix domain-containing protein [Streptosporangium]|uniref:AraC-like DNA-binding protein n=1 Tax=Streptosporangium brasiliense TaxID=47480 RepID=A0ABT9RAG7_9ACTN|nr:helix-turn-helix domain-containing protein [Streptosporangium brasiliense]MDP9866218.1 AraC-like DNA-binding protein [Streptosporangium brasiliense]
MRVHRGPAPGRPGAGIPGTAPRAAGGAAGSAPPGPAVTPAGDTRGILNAGAARFGYGRHACHPSLAPFVEHHWIIRWDLTEPYEQRVVSHPSVNLVFQERGSRVAGVITGDYLETLAGTGVVAATRFRPGGFRPFLGAPVSTLTDRFPPVSEVFGPAAEATAPAVLAASDAGAVALLDAFLLARLPPRDPVAERVGAMVAGIVDSPGITRVDDLAARHGLTVRTLQRLFSDYVGVSPKWVIRRYRIHEAAERASAATDWSRLAAELGYSDQAHLTRDFTSVVGMSPTAYARSAVPARPSARPAGGTAPAGPPG